MSREAAEDSGHEPLEEVGPDGCNARVADVDADRRETADPVGEVSLLEELGEPYAAEADPWVLSPTDGLPTVTSDQGALALAPPFALDTLICVEDGRQWVELFEDELGAHHVYVQASRADRARACRVRALRAAQTVCVIAIVLAVGLGWQWELILAGGTLGFAALVLDVRLMRSRTGEWLGPDQCRVAFDVRGRYGAGGHERRRRNYDPALVEHAYGCAFVGGADRIVFVRPRRPVCRYYQRQIVGNDDQPDISRPGHQIILRNCTMRRSVGGAYMSLRDQAVYACDYRSPPDPDTTRARLDEPDAARLAARAAPNVPLFNLVRRDGASPPPKEKPV